MGFDPKMTRQDLENMTNQEFESRMDEQMRKEEGRPPSSAARSICFPAFVVFAIIAIVIILSFLWRSCIP